MLHFLGLEEAVHYILIANVNSEQNFIAFFFNLTFKTIRNAGVCDMQALHNYNRKVSMFFCSVHKCVMDCVTAITKCLISRNLLSVDYGMIQGIFHNAVDLNRL